MTLGFLALSRSIAGMKMNESTAAPFHWLERLGTLAVHELDGVGEFAGRRAIATVCDGGVGVRALGSVPEELAALNDCGQEKGMRTLRHFSGASRQLFLEAFNFLGVVVGFHGRFIGAEKLPASGDHLT